MPDRIILGQPEARQMSKRRVTVFDNIDAEDERSRDLIVCCSASNTSLDMLTSRCIV